jgi:hypothetical protein
MSCGCTVISTPIPHAVEMLSDEYGILLTKFDDAKSLEAILCENKSKGLLWVKMLFSQSRTSWEILQFNTDCYSIN